jgi:hypothetical protein
MRAKEFTKPGTITLDQIYDGQMPERDEHIWNYVSRNDFNVPFTINTIQPISLRSMLEIQYGVDDIEDLFHKMQPEQEEIVQHYVNNSDLSKQIIILHKDHVVDGNHRALAAALAKKPIRYIDVSEDTEEVNEDEETPKNLAWRIRFKRFKDMDPLLPEREGKLYFMPFDHSAVRTFSNLTGKDHYKISNMPTEVYELPDDAMVYDMKIINSVNNARNYAYNERNPERKAQYEKMIDYHKKQYLKSGVPFSQYKPGMFDYPEILADPSKVRKIENRGVTYDKNTGQIKLTDRTK